MRQPIGIQIGPREIRQQNETSLRRVTGRGGQRWWTPENATLFLTSVRAPNRRQIEREIVRKARCFGREPPRPRATSMAEL
jgi:hypothetical protein